MWEGQLSVMRGRVNELERENGRLGEEKGELGRQRDILQGEEGRCEAVEQDLGHVLQLIQDGVNSGTLRVSTLQDTPRCDGSSLSSLGGRGRGLLLTRREREGVPPR